MTRLLRILTACAVCSVAACGSDDTVKIVVFQASPDTIEAGQSTQLVFAVEPPSARVTIGGVGDLSGQTHASVAPTMSTAYQLTATSGSAIANATVMVTVGPTSASAIKVDPATTTPAAGAQLPVVLTVLANNGKPAPGFRGTVHIASTDPKATLPADVTFAAADMGTKTVMVTLETAGLSTLTATDITAKAGVQGSRSVTVQPGPATLCIASQAPASAAAGAVVGLTVAVHDAFGNAATGYSGTVQVTATDARAVLPANVTYTPASDAGSHAFSVQLVTTGDQTVTATDTANAAIVCTTKVTVTPGAMKIAVTVPSDANSGYAVPVAVAVVDAFDNPRPGFKGTVSFASSDSGTGASTPGSITFAGTENGLASTTATFVTLGPQTLSGTVVEDVTSLQATSNAAARVHGLVYTAPTTGRIRLVQNMAQSNGNVIQLDLVADERLERSSFFTIRVGNVNVPASPASFAMGMNLPLDTTRVTAGAALFTTGGALTFTLPAAPPPAPPPTPVPPFGLGRIGSDHVLYTAVSMKRVSTLPVLTQATEVQAGQVFYSVRLKLTPGGTVGPVFDGAQPLAMYRASVRDQFGDDFVQQSDFGVGKLEVR